MFQRTALLVFIALGVTDGLKFRLNDQSSKFRLSAASSNQKWTQDSSVPSKVTKRVSLAALFAASFFLGSGGPLRAIGDTNEPVQESITNSVNSVAITEDSKAISTVDISNIRLPYFHENVPLKQHLGTKATIVFNMKIDDPQTVLQFPDIVEIYNRYGGDGLNVLAFPSEQGWFEPDDDETCRAKAKEYYGFGNYPTAVVFDKVDILGPSSHPFYAALTQSFPTPNGYGRITLNYEKFLLDSNGQPVRRYPRKFSAYDMEADIQALIKDEPIPPESPQFKKAWREAKREAVKSEYAFRYNYNYYTAPDSMYKYDSSKDVESSSNT